MNFFRRIQCAIDPYHAWTVVGPVDSPHERFGWLCQCEWCGKVRYMCELGRREQADVRRWVGARKKAIGQQELAHAARLHRETRNV